jgi:EAL domain-containing protein (putative c-di-GMP-specific phosphodiesterase class I)
MPSFQVQFNAAFTEALHAQRIEPYFQPIVCLASGRIVGFESLARWVTPDHRIISPSVFIHRAERGNMLDEFMNVFMIQVFRAAAAWPSPLFVTLNLSPSQLLNRELPFLVQEVADAVGFHLSRLKIEITETAMINDLERARAAMEAFLGLGCAISLDDFGTGFSSMTWLRSLPFKTIKIDQSFVQSMLREKESRKIVSALVGLGRSLDLDVVAEGVETEEEANLLRLIGCPLAQGYLYGKPLPAAMVPDVLEQQAPIGASVALERMSLEQRAYQISALYRASEISVCFVDKHYVIVDASETFAHRIGRSLGEIVGCPLYEILPQERSRLPWLRSFRERGLPYPAYEFKRPDGQTDVVTLICVRDEIGEVLGFFILAVNISSLKT